MGKVNIETILNLSLGDREFEAIAPLFNWPGALLCGAEGLPVRTDEPDTLKEKSFPEFGYGDGASAAPGLDERKKPSQASSRTSAQTMRSRLLDSPATTKEESTAEFSRPTLAAAFEMFNQQVRAGDRPIPVIPLPPILEPNFSFEAIALAPESRLDGAEWVLSNLSEQALEFKLLTRSLIERLEISGAAQALYAHMEKQSSAAEMIDLFEEFDLHTLRTAAQHKVDRVIAQCQKLAEAARIPVLDAQGEVFESLSIANQVVAAIAVRDLLKTAGEILGFLDGAIAAIHELKRVAGN